MGYFTYIAAQSFKTSATGERLFYRGGPWSRPFIIPDADTEQRLLKKQVRILQILFGVLFVGLQFLYLFFPRMVKEPYWFVASLAVMMAVSLIINWIMLARDLRGLPRAPVRLKPAAFYGQTAKQHTRGGLLFGLAGCLLFIVLGVWDLRSGGNPALGIFCIGFFSLCGLAWGYALFLKLRRRDFPIPPPDERRD